jgi:tyrosyl-tRNA synthetase
LTPQLLKPAVTEALISLLEPIQAEFQASPAWQEIETKAYPPPPAAAKKEKKKKDKGTFHPKKVEAQTDGHVEGEDREEVSIGKDSGAKEMEKLGLEDRKE